ncbi:surface protease GP63, putative, partial [Trypanosoma cruzi]
GSVITVTLENFEKDGKIKCPKYVEVCTIAANGSSLVIPSVLEDDKGEEQEEQVKESVVASALSPAEEPHEEASSRGQPHAESKAQASPAEEPYEEASSPGQPHEEKPRAAASSTEEPHAQASTAEESHAEAFIAGKTSEASIAGKTSEAPVVQATLQQPQQESKAGQNATVGESAITQHVPANKSQGSVGKPAVSNSHAAGEATGDAGTMSESGLLPSLLLLLGLWGVCGSVRSDWLPRGTIATSAAPTHTPGSEFLFINNFY